MVTAQVLIAVSVCALLCAGGASLLRRRVADSIGLVLLAAGVAMLTWAASIVAPATFLGAGAALVLASRVARVVEEAGRVARRERELRLITDNLPAFIARIDRSFRYRFVNERFAEQFGLSRGRIVGLEIRDVIGDVAAATLRPFHERALAGEEVMTEQRLVLGDGQVMWVSSRYVPDRASDGSIVGFYAMVTDVTARVQAEDDLKESRERLEAILSSASDLIFALDAGGRVLFLNRGPSGPNVESMVGSVLHDERYMPRRSGDALREALRAVFEEEQEQSLELETYCGSETRWYLCRLTAIVRSSRVAEATMVATDITDKREAERRLRQSQRLDAVGRLAEGVAHDFSNYLMAIRGHLELALLWLGEQHAARAPVVRAIQATEQATGAARSLLTFSAESEPSKKPVDLCEAVARTLDLVGAVLPAAIEVLLVTPAAPVWVEGDADQIGQVVMNLALNARDAMARGGRLDVTVGARESMGRRHAILEVRDTGSGLSPEARERIFEPYFTTKERGEGTGLGLPIVHGIVRAHGGTIDVESEHGRGTTIRITMPAIDAPSGHTAEIPSNTRGIVLMVDDNDLVRGALSAQLRMLGFKVVEAADASTALNEFVRRGNSVSLFVLDQDLPGMSGVACLERLREAGASGGALIVTGSLSALDEDLEALGARLLRKPFTLEALREAAAACVAAGGGRARSDLR